MTFGLQAKAQSEPNTLVLQNQKIAVEATYSLCDINGRDMGFYLLNFTNKIENKDVVVKIFEGSVESNRLLHEVVIPSNSTLTSECGSEEAVKVYVFNPYQDDAPPMIEDLQISFLVQYYE